MDENFSVKRRKVYDNGSSSKSTTSNMPLYLGAAALLVSGATAFFLYKEMKKIKSNGDEMRKVKNQLLNIDSKLEDNSILLNKTLHMFNAPVPHHPSQLPQQKHKKPDIELVVDSKDEKDIEGVESDEESVLSYEED